MRDFGTHTVPVLASLPGTGVAGQTVVVSNIHYHWDTSVPGWVAFGGSSGGGFTVVTKAASYTETTVSGEIVILANLAAGFTITLPTAVGNTAKYRVKKLLAAGAITIQCNGAQTIDGGTTAVLNNQYESITFVSDGANWYII